MIAVVTYLWGTKYRPAHVQRLAASVARWLTVPHVFTCVADRDVPGVFTVKDPAPQYPARCYRRLWLFSPDAERLGYGILHLDLDVVVCGSLDALIRPEPFVIYKAPSIARRGYSLNPSVFWLRTGSQRDIWDAYRQNPARLGSRAQADGFWGSDQAVISYLRRDALPPTFGDADGIVSFRRIRAEALTAPPEGTRIVSFHGRRTPFDRDVQAAHPWIQDAWRVAA